MVEYYETNYLSVYKVEETHQFLIKGKMRSKAKTVKPENLKQPF